MKKFVTLGNMLFIFGAASGGVAQAETRIDRTKMVVTPVAVVAGARAVTAAEKADVTGRAADRTSGLGVRSGMIQRTGSAVSSEGPPTSNLRPGLAARLNNRR